MLELKNTRYGSVIIFDETDVVDKKTFLTIDGSEEMSETFRCEFQKRIEASVIGFRNKRKRIVKLLKNRFGSLKDSDIMKFVYTYSDIKISRFDLMDLD